MKTQDEVQERCRLAAEEMVEIIQKHKLTVGEVSGICGSVFGVTAAQTEKNFPFISFFTSFSSTYSDRDHGTEIHGVTQPLKMR